MKNLYKMSENELYNSWKDKEEKDKNFDAALNEERWIIFFKFSKEKKDFKKELEKFKNILKDYPLKYRYRKDNPILMAIKVLKNLIKQEKNKNLEGKKMKNESIKNIIKIVVLGVIVGLILNFIIEYKIEKVKQNIIQNAAITHIEATEDGELITIKLNSEYVNYYFEF